MGYYKGISTEEKEQYVFEFIKQKVKVSGYPPTVREICKALGFKSTSTAHTYLRKLEDKGKITIEHEKPRTISIKLKDKQIAAHDELVVEKNKQSIPIKFNLDNKSLTTLHKFCNSHKISVDEAIKIAINKLK